ncbi:hypothetical protein CCH79_00008479 [Gambusia affinis]|uniref:Distal membrane-arm assembly complex protein 1-like domain-containing protein n=1 Tax=Gambusia affinis TaxID=33528 RepID=A0A315UW28_GAMAF|nr:hypothetical protein CCH79_00008479 [Gambusia affinis]
MSSAPESTAAPSKPLSAFQDCWGCRAVSGGGLILSAAYVFNAARRVMKQGAPTSIGTVLQLTFAASLAAWGVVIIADPVGGRGFTQNRQWRQSGQKISALSMTVLYA